MTAPAHIRALLDTMACFTPYAVEAMSDVHKHGPWAVSFLGPCVGVSHETLGHFVSLIHRGEHRLLACARKHERPPSGDDKDAAALCTYAYRDGALLPHHIEKLRPWIDTDSQRHRVITKNARKSMQFTATNEDAPGYDEPTTNYDHANVRPDSPAGPTGKRYVGADLVQRLRKILRMKTPSSTGATNTQMPPHGENNAVPVGDRLDTIPDAFHNYR